MSSGQTSPLGYFERMDDDSFDEDSPVSAVSAFLLRNNLMHLRDMCTQQRLCAGESEAQDTWYFGALAPYGGLVAGEDYEAVWWQPFPHTWFGPRIPTNLDIGVGLRFQTPIDATIRMRAVPHYSPHSGRMVPIGTGTALVDESTAVTASDTAILAATNFFTEEQAAQIQIVPTAFPGVMLEDGVYVVPLAMVMRLEVIVTRTDSGASALAKMSGVYVREFA